MNSNNSHLLLSWYFTLNISGGADTKALKGRTCDVERRADTSRMRNPIGGVMETKVVSLDEACKPLIPILNKTGSNINTYYFALFLKMLNDTKEEDLNIYLIILILRF